MKDDPASKLVQNFNQYERIKKKLLLRMAVMSYVTKFQARELKVSMAKATSNTKDVPKLSPMTMKKSEKISDLNEINFQKHSSHDDIEMMDLECKQFEKQIRSSAPLNQFPSFQRQSSLSLVKVSSQHGTEYFIHEQEQNSIVHEDDEKDYDSEQEEEKK